VAHHQRQHRVRGEHALLVAFRMIVQCDELYDGDLLSGFQGRWRLLRYTAVQVECCEISVGWHAGIPAARQEYPEPAAYQSLW
jgi:hypothetical protein